MRGHVGIVAWVLGVGILASASLARGGEPPGRFDDHAVIKAEVVMLRGTVKRQAEQIEKLKAEGKPFQDEVAGLREDVAKLREENERLRKQIEVFRKASGTGERKGITFVPLMGDETSVAEILADRRKYLNKGVILCGGVAVKQYYNYRYEGAERTHVSLGFEPVGADGRRLPVASSIDLYVQRDIAGPLVAASTEAIKAGFSHKVIRVRAVMLPARFAAEGAPQLEVLDWQLLEPDGTGWGPWVQKRTDKQPAKDKRKGQ